MPLPSQRGRSRWTRFHPTPNGNRAMIFWRARRYDDAIRSSQLALDLDPNFVNALWWQGLAYAGKGDFPKSIACLTRAAGMNHGSLFRVLRAYVYGRAGDKAKALGTLDEITTMSSQGYVSPVDFAVVYAGLGDADSTFAGWKRHMRRGLSELSNCLRCTTDSVRSDRRYEGLRKRIGLPLSGSRLKTRRIVPGIVAQIVDNSGKRLWMAV